MLSCIVIGHKMRHAPSHGNAPSDEHALGHAADKLRFPGQVPSPKTLREPPPYRDQNLAINL